MSARQPHRPGARGSGPGLGHVLCVEDDPVVQYMLSDIIRTAGGQYRAASSAREAEDLLDDGRYDLVLLDRRLPDSDGLLLLHTIKRKSDCPVIVLTAMDETRDKILGLGLGAAEYVTKPFNPAELSSRVRSILTDRERRRSRLQAAPIDHGRLHFEPATRRLMIDGSECFLPPAEARLLLTFLQHEGEVRSRAQLIDSACGRDWLPGDRTVDVLVARLRRHLPAEVAEIVTVHRAGYLFLFRDRPPPGES